MRKPLPQFILLMALISLCTAGFLAVNHILDLPFRSTNDQLHQVDAPLNLDFLIPGGTYIDEKMTIGEVIRAGAGKKMSAHEQIMDSVSRLLPMRIIIVADLALFLFWSFMFMTVIRVFTFCGYGRALRTSLLLGGILYYFIPDFTPGRIDDAALVIAPALIIILRAWSRHKKKRSGFGARLEIGD